MTSRECAVCLTDKRRHYLCNKSSRKTILWYSLIVLFTNDGISPKIYIIHDEREKFVFQLHFKIGN